MVNAFIIRITIIIAILFNCSNKLYAGQYSGGEIIYQLISKGTDANSYKIIFRVNRNCKSYAEFNISPEVWFFNSKSGIPHTKGFKLTLSQFNRKRLAIIQSDFCAINPPDLCNDLIEFVGYIDLPNDPNGFLVYVTDCCRNDQKNLEPESWNAGSEIVAGVPEPGYSFTYYTRIPPQTLVPVNNSPYSKTDSLFGVCVGSKINYQLDYTDPDGDVLKFSFGDATGKTDIGISQLRSINYKSGYDNLNPFGTNNSLYLDPNTGIISGTVSSAGNYIMVIEIEEWRNGLLINTHRRELELNVVNCKGKLPQIPISCENPVIYFGSHYNDPSLNYRWDFGVPTIQSDTSNEVNPLYRYTTSGQFNVTLILSNAKGCRDTVKTVATLYPDLFVDFSWKEPICNGMPLQLINKSAFPSGNITSYRWNFNSGRTGNIVFSRDKDPYFNYSYTDSVPLAYSIQLNITTDKGCNATINKTPIIYPTPNANIGRDTTITFDVPYEIPLKHSSQNSYLWSPTNGLSNPKIANPIITGNVNQCYQLKVWGKDSICINYGKICISYGKGPDVFVPSAFTPNGDGLNDRVSFKAVQVQVEEFIIFDRWGQKIFSTNNSAKSWDGRINGIKQEMGVFVWVVKGVGPGNKSFVKSGTIMLMR